MGQGVIMYQYDNDYRKDKVWTGRSDRPDHVCRFRTRREHSIPDREHILAGVDGDVPQHIPGAVAGHPSNRSSGTVRQGSLHAGMSFEITIDLTRVLTETDPGQDFFIYFRDLSGPMKLTRTSFFFITALVTAVEAIIILYNNATGYVPLHGPFEFFVRLAFGVVAGTPVAMILFVLDTAVAPVF